MTVIEAKELCKSYGGVKALQNVSFQVQKGEVIGLLGPNGAGKTTLMKLLTGYLQPDSGQAFVDGTNIASDPLVAQRAIGYLPENAPVYQDMAVQEYLQMMATLRQIPADKQRAMLSEAIYATGLEDYLTRPIGNLSKGYRQRVGIAQAIVHKPDVLILDEPTTGLDPTQIVEIRDLIQRLASHSTVLLSTHILHEVEMTCQRVIVIAGGTLHTDSSIAALNHANNSVVVKIAKVATGVAEVLRAVDGVVDVVAGETQQGFVSWTVTGHNDDMATLLFDALRTRDWKVSELRAERRSLEAVFRELAHKSEKPLN